MKYDWLEAEKVKPNNFINWVITEAMSKKDENLTVFLPFDSRDMDIQMTINGIDVPVVEVLNSIENEIERMVKRKARKLIEEKFHKLDRAIKDTEEKFNRLMLDEV